MPDCILSVIRGDDAEPAQPDFAVLAFNGTD
jgi:hypothetical protein